MKKSGVDSKVMIPVWMINDRELWLIYNALEKMQIYVPALMIPDVQRVQDVKGKIGSYLGIKKYHQKEIVRKEIKTGMLDHVIPDLNAYDEKGKKI
jgi:hypothetical protein